MPVATSRAAASPATAAATSSQIRPPNTVVSAMANGELRKKSSCSASARTPSLVIRKRDDEQDGEEEPGPGTAHLVGELEAKDPPELHAHRRRRLLAAPADVPRHRAEVDVLEVRLGGLEAGAGRRRRCRRARACARRGASSRSPRAPAPARRAPASRSRGARSGRAGRRPRAAARPRAGSRPRSMIAIRVHSSLTSSTMCVERRTTLFSPSSLSRFRKRTRSAGSRPAVGSSTIISFGLPSSATATPKRCRMPPE